MKYYLLMFLSIYSFCIVTAQQTQLEIDTTKANEYLQQTQYLKDGSTEKITLIEKAAELCSKHDIPKKIITVNSLLTYEYAKAENEKVIEIGQANIDFAKTKFQNDKLPELALTYCGLQDYLSIVDFENSGYHGVIALQLLSKNSVYYFESACRLIQFYTSFGDEIELNKIIKKIQVSIETNRNELPINANFALYFGQFMNNYLQENNELIIIYGQQLLFEIDYNELNYKKPFFYENIGLAYSSIGQQKKAKEWIEKLKRTATFSDDNLSYYEAMARFHSENDHYEAAIPFLEKAISIYKKSTYEEDEFYARDLLEEIAFCYIKQDKFEKAKEQLSKARRYEASFQPYIVDIYTAILLNHTQQYDEGLQYIQQALISVSTNFNNTSQENNPLSSDEFDSKYWAAIALKTKAHLILNKYEKTNNVIFLDLARKTAQISINLLIQMQQNIRGYETSKLYMNKEIGEVSQLMQDIEYQQYKLKPNKEQLNVLFKTTEQYKAIALLETLTPQKLPKHILLQEKELINKIRTLERTLLTLKKSQIDSINYYRNALIKATYEFEKFQSNLKGLYLKPTATTHNFSYVDIETIQQKLPKHTLWIEYAYNQSADLLYIYSINQLEATLHTVSINDDFFDDIIKLHHLLKNPFLIQKTKQQNYISISYRLYQKLITPILPLLTEIENLYIVPEQTLFNIPFEVLLPTNELKPFDELDYLIRDYAIGYQYSATTFFSLRTRPTIQDKSLLAFAPVFNKNQSVSSVTRSFTLFTDSLYRSVNNGGFMPLPNTKTEVERISKILKPYNNPQIFLEQDATKSNLLNALNKQPYQYVHLATHGLVNFENYKLSALACFNENKQNHSLLFVDEVMLQEINVDLVVLSSCESGIGQLIGSEGLIALNRSFIHAGAKNVIFSLWKVNDKYSSELMINFYTNQSETINYINALRLAKLQLIENSDSAIPRFWAAFVIIGE